VCGRVCVCARENASACACVVVCCGDLHILDNVFFKNYVEVQCVAVCCRFSVTCLLHCVASCRCVLQCVAAAVAVCCSDLHSLDIVYFVHRGAVWCSVL